MQPWHKYAIVAAVVAVVVLILGLSLGLGLRSSAQPLIPATFSVASYVKADGTSKDGYLGQYSEVDIASVTVNNRTPIRAWLHDDSGTKGIITTQVINSTEQRLSFIEIKTDGTWAVISSSGKFDPETTNLSSPALTEAQSWTFNQTVAFA